MSLLLLLAACDSGVLLPHDTGEPPVGLDSADSADSGTHLPGDTSVDSGDSADTADTADTAEEPWSPGTPDVVVDCKGGADFTTITEAIAAEPSGTHIGLRPCTYAEEIDYLGKSLDIFGIEGAETTIIQGDGKGPVVTVADGESVGTRLAGVTVTGGGGGGGGGGTTPSAISVDGAVLRLDHVILADNERAYSVLQADGSFLELADVDVHDNTVSGSSGPFLVDNGSLVAERLTADCNGGGFTLYEHNSTLLRESTLTCDSGYGIYVSGGELQLRESRVVAGQVAVYGEDNNDTRNERMWLFNSALVGGTTAVEALYMHVKANHDVFYGSRVGLELTRVHVESYVVNSVGVGSQCGIRTDGDSLLFGWNALEHNGNGCAEDAFSTVTAAPGFVDAPDDLHLRDGSPLVDAGDPDADAEDRDGSRSDIGVYGGPEAPSW